ncbi:MAG TPA: aspartyl protease family protein [Acetobacteraceae bacterium]|jgi:predicted aspartyl protease
MPNQLLDRGTKPRIAGLLGAPAFTGRIIRIDVARRELTILPPGSPPAAGGYQVPLSIDYGAAILRAGQLAPILNGMTLNIDLDGVLPVLLDTGYSGTLKLPHDMAEQTGALERYPKYLPIVSPGGGIDGPGPILAALGTRLSIGGAEIASPYLEIMRDAPPRHVGRWPRRPGVALLDMGILQHLILFIDVPNSRLVLEPGGIPRHNPVIVRSPGLSAVKKPRDAFEILSVLKGSPTAPAAPVTLPIVYEGGHVLIEVAVASAPPAPFILDTGASAHTSDAGYANEIRLASSGYLGAQGVAGRSVRAGLAQGVPLRQGPLTLTGQPAAVIDMPNPLLDHGKKPRLAGLIGAAAFAGRIMRIDVARHELTILPPGSPPNPAGRQIPLSIAYGAVSQGPGQIAAVNGMTLDIELNGSVLSAQFDTGAGSALVLPRDVAEQTGALHRYPKCLLFVVPGGIDGRLLYLEALGTRLSIGGAEIASPFVSIIRDAPSPNTSRWVRPRQVALLGMGALQYFTLFIDVPNNRLVLEPDGIPQHSPVVFRSSGLSAAKLTRNAFEILSVSRAAPPSARACPPATGSSRSTARRQPHSARANYSRPRTARMRPSSSPWRIGASARSDRHSYCPERAPYCRKRIDSFATGRTVFGPRPPAFPTLSWSPPPAVEVQ